MDVADARGRFAAARVARLATVDTDARPHLVPVCFAVVAETLVSVVDHKRKRTSALQRLRNIETNPHVSVLVDHYDEEWANLWWVRADGVARVVRDGPDHVAAIALLTDKYAQYRRRPPTGPVVIVDVIRWSSWSLGGT